MEWSMLSRAGMRVARTCVVYGGALLFFLMLFLPTSYTVPKAFLLSFLLGAVLLGAKYEYIKLELHKSVQVWLVTLIGIGAIFIARGYLRDAPGALRVGTVYLLWPLVFALFIAAIRDMSMVRKLFVVLVAAGIALGFYWFVYIAHAAGILPPALYIKLDQGQGIGFYEGYIEYTAYSIATLLYLVPFLFAALMQIQNGDLPISRRWLWLAYTLCLALAILSGRRALWVILLFTPLIYIFFYVISAKEVALKLVLRRSGALILLTAGVFLVLQGLFGLSPAHMLSYLLNGVPTPDVGADVEVSASIRYSQAIALFDGWLEEPWFGHGHGAAASLIRDQTMPWAYELQYLALLFHTGVVGTLAYSTCIGVVFLWGLRVIRRPGLFGRLMLPLLVGLACFLIANATNPYLLKFDYMWTVFLPLLLINKFMERTDAEARA